MSPTSRDELLIAYAAGDTSPGLSLLCAAHLTLRPDGRALVESLEEVGGAFLTSDPAEDVAPLDFEDLLGRLDETEAVAPAPLASTDFGADTPLPDPIRRQIGVRFADIPWRFKLPGLSVYDVAGFDGEHVSLLRGRPGARIPHHTHSGVEATLVLSGALRDGDDLLDAGDIAICGPEDHHHPEIAGHETCYCLAVTDGSLRFTGALGRALNLFADAR